MRQPAHQTGAGAQALGTSSPLRIYPVLLLQGADAETTSGPALGRDGGLPAFGLGGFNDLLFSAWWLA